MKPKRLVRRARANDDVDVAIDYYLNEGGKRAAEAFIDALEVAFQHIARFPGAGSPRYGIELDVENLPSWPLRRYPFLVFYMERVDTIEILRLLHTQREPGAYHERDRQACNQHRSTGARAFHEG